MVKIRGYRVELKSVESALRNLYLIKDAAVVVHEEKPGEQKLVAYIVPRELPAPKPEALRTILTKEYPDHMIPSQFVFMQEFPQTATGKIDRNSLPVPTLNNAERDLSYQPPRDELESQLCKIWGRVLGIEQVGREDNFFDLGGTSLQAMSLFVEIERLVGKELPLALLFKASTVTEQAVILRQEDWKADWFSLVAVQPAGTLPPLFCLPGIGGNVLTFHDLSRHLGAEQPCYALQSKGLGGKEKPHTFIEDIAAHHIKEIKQIQPRGPYYLVWVLLWWDGRL